MLQVILVQMTLLECVWILLGAMRRSLGMLPYIIFSKLQKHPKWVFADKIKNPKETFRSCRDDAIKDSVCIPSFDESPMCQAPINSVFYWPTTVPCADRLAELYRVDPEHTRAVHDIVLAAKKECELITSQVCSLSVDPYFENSLRFGPWEVTLESNIAQTCMYLHRIDSDSQGPNIYMPYLPVKISSGRYIHPVLKSTPYMTH